MSDNMHSITQRRKFLGFLGTIGIAAALPSVRSWGFQTPPQPSGEKSFPAIAFNHISYNVHAYSISRDFYAKLLGAKLVFDNGKQCSLEFGTPANALYIRNLKDLSSKARFDHFCFSIAHFNSQEVVDELKRRNLSPKVDGKYAWAFHDPNGFNIHICAEHGVYPGQNAPGASADFTGPMPLQPEGAGHAPLHAVAATLNIRSKDVIQSRDFYQSLLGMRKIHESENECLLTFGHAGDVLAIRKLDEPGGTPFIESVAFAVKPFKVSDVMTALDARKLAPQKDALLGISAVDPDGSRFGVIPQKVV